VKNLFRLFFMCMVSMLAFAQTDASYDPAGLRESAQESPSGVTLSPQSWDFSNDLAADFPSNELFTLHNGSSNVIYIGRISAVPNPPFSVPFTNCPAALAPGNSCYIEAQLKAANPGQKTGVLTVNCTGASGCPFSANLSGTVVRDVTVYPSGDCATPCLLTLTNNQPVPLSIYSVEVQPSPPYEIANFIHSCKPNTSVQPGSFCNIYVTGDSSGNGTVTVTDSSLDGSPSHIVVCGRLYCQP
jgi:hypothetical protein